MYFCRAGPMAWLSLVGSAVHQCQNPLPLRVVIEGMKPADLIETTNGIECVEKTRVARRQLIRLEITTTQIRIAKRAGALPREKVESQPSAVGGRDALGFSEK